MTLVFWILAPVSRILDYKEPVHHDFVYSIWISCWGYEGYEVRVGLIGAQAILCIAIALEITYLYLLPVELNCSFARAL